MCENDVEGVERSLNSFNCYSCYSSWKSQKWCLRLLCNTVYRVMLLILLMSKGSKVYSVCRASHPSKGKAIYLKSLLSCGFSFSPPVSLRRQLCSLSWTCQLQRWLQARCTANPQFLKLIGCSATQYFLHIYKQSCILHAVNKLHAYCNFDLKSIFNAWRMWACRDGRFSFWQSWLTWASRFANSQASALNAGVPTAPYSPESNYLHLVLIWPVKELYSLWASCTVNK